MSYKVAALDVHKSVLMVVVATAGDEVADPSARNSRLNAGGSEPAPANGCILRVGCRSEASPKW